MQQACIIVDAGTAVTVDFVDGQGTFLGGAIAPGIDHLRRKPRDILEGLAYQHAAISNLTVISRALRTEC